MMHTFKKKYRSQNYAYLRSEVTKYEQGFDDDYENSKEHRSHQR